MKRWIICQIGAREHYAVARALHHRGLLEELITDAWAPGGSLLSRLPGQIGARLAGRYEPSLASASVSHMTGLPALPQYVLRRLAPERDALRGTIRHNAKFDAYAAGRLKDLVQRSSWADGPVVYSYSYAAGRIFNVAKESGLTTVLGQIDGGPAENELVGQISERHGLREHPLPLPASYWDAWRAECDLAGRIVVNSRWSKNLLARVGIDAAKICVIPLIHAAGPVNRSPRRYPQAFLPARPLRALFLGSLIVRKGIIELLQAAELLRHAPVEFWLVGPDPEGHATRASQLPNVKLVGAVPRGEVERYYEDADVFVFPTHSDGFGLTQLEAQACGLPVLTTPFCGDVVEHGKNGLVASEVSAGEIVAALEYCLKHPGHLETMSAEALKTGSQFSSDAVIPTFLSLADPALRSG